MLILFRLLFHLEVSFRVNVCIFGATDDALSQGVFSQEIPVEI